MEILYINIFFGISVFLKYNYIFEYLLNNNLHSEIHVSVDRDIIKYYRDTFPDNFYNELYESLKFIFINPKIKIIYDAKFTIMCINDLLNKYNITLKYNILNHLITNENYINEQYITITTKVFNTINYDEYNLIKDQLFSILNNSKYKIILLGEREITNSREYEMYCSFSIYNDCIKNLNNKLDFTIDNTTSNNNIDLLKKSFNILNKSKLNIYFNTAGISVISLFVSNNILGLIKNEYKDIYDTINFLHENKNIELCYDINYLLNKLEIFINN